MKRALICGISGQDGAYLARYLLSRGYDVFGTSRDAQISPFWNLSALGIRERIRCESVSLTDFRSVLQVLTKTEPDEVYNLGGQSSVGLSFEQPVETLESVTLGTLNLLEAIRFIAKPIKFYNASSGECFGDTREPANEHTSFRPRSPYAVAKAAAFWELDNYREAYGLFACSGILFNHESPLRPRRFVTQKIAHAAVRIASGHKEKLRLGNIRVERDWGYAPEYVEAMWLMMQQPRADDYIIATGVSTTLEAFISEAFGYLGLDWHDHVESDESLLRPTDILSSRADPSKARSTLGWSAKTRLPELVRKMIDAARERREVLAELP